MKIQFLGANRQVTGSRYYFEAAGNRLLIDCGLFQERDYLARNWEPSPIPAAQIDAVLLTHAHLDHCGLLPRLVSRGYRGPIYATSASKELAAILLMDSARIQEEDAAFKRRRHEREQRRGPHPEVPLYVEADVRETLRLFQVVAYDAPLTLANGLTVRFQEAGHILGSASLQLRVPGAHGARTVVFSGDVGQHGKPIIRDPRPPESADYVIMESTYGDRNHQAEGDIPTRLEEIINTTVEAGGNVIIPTFAVERAQELMYYISRLIWENRIPQLMVFLDSPMAVNATEVFRRHEADMDDEAVRLLETAEPLFRFPGMTLVRTTSQSKAINRIRGSCIIMAGSGMCTGGRIKHHLARHVPREESTVLFVGYQAEGTLGRELLRGRPQVRIHGQMYPVRARIAQINGLSAHADQEGLLDWVGHVQPAPRRVFLTHGESRAATTLAGLIGQRCGCTVDIPKYQEIVHLE